MTEWVVFDLNGTLLDPAGVGAQALDRAILSAMTLNHVGEYRPFTLPDPEGAGADLLEVAHAIVSIPRTKEPM